MQHVVVQPLQHHQVTAQSVVAALALTFGNAVCVIPCAAAGALMTSM
jgi:hypothetical protein